MTREFRQGSAHWPSLIKAMRKTRRWSQGALAEALGSNQETVSRWERGVVVPSLAMQRQIEQLSRETGNPARGGISHIVNLTLHHNDREDGQSNSHFAPSITVLPFTHEDRDQLLADGLVREIIFLLARQRDVLVTAPDTAFHFRDKALLPIEAGRSLGVNYTLSGTLLHRSHNVRIAIQLNDVSANRAVWSGDFDASLQALEVEQIVEEIAARVCGTLIGLSGVIDKTSRKRTHSFQAYNAVLLFYAYTESYTAELHLRAKTALLKAVQEYPDYAEAWACLGGIYGSEYMFGYNHEIDSLPPLERAIAACKKAIQLAPDCLLGQFGLANCYFYRGDRAQFQYAAENALSLGPNRADVLANMGMFFALDGDSARGLSLLERAMGLNPLHPGWYWLAYFDHAYKKGDYSQALMYAERINAPNWFIEPLFIAMAEGQLGNEKRASQALQEAMRLNPLIIESPRKVIARIQPDESRATHYLDGLRLAGLGLPPQNPNPK